MKGIFKIIMLAGFTLANTVAFADDAQTTTTNTTTASTAAVPADDATLNQTVQSKLAAEPVLASKTIIAKTNQGIVVLTATLDTSDQANKAVEIAESVPGVQDVDTSQLAVKDSKQPMTDSYTTAKIKGVFLREKLFGNVDVPVVKIHVTTKDGVVYLTGVAASKDQIAKAITLVRSIKDVKKVDAKVHVEKQ